MKTNSLFFIITLFPVFTLVGQDNSDSLWVEQLNTVEISAPRIDGEDTRLPIALSVIGQTQIQKAQAQLSLQESLPFVPGLFAINPDNFAQDLRVSIRGFGARAAFGIRGIKILVDGLPETTPDGQSQLDNLDLGVVKQIEVIRGPSSGLYGNASGGVIQVNTEDPSSNFFAETRLLAGSYGLQQYQLKAGQQVGKFGYLIHGAHTSMDGYRENSGVKNTLLNGKFNLDLSEASKFRLILNHVNSPQADDPGGINQEAVNEDRRQARDRNLQFKSGEEVQQSKVGLVYEGIFSSKHQLQARLFYLSRDFNNRLPFGFGGIVDLSRSYLGGGFTYQFSNNSEKLAHKLKIGLDWDDQTDDRLRFVNLDGEQGDKTLDQEESFSNIGLYVLQDFEWKNFMIKLGLRYDAAKLQSADRFISNGDDSGEINLNNFNPIFGLSFQIHPAFNVYGNFSSSFETPTLTELSNNPNGQGGFNDQLNPQKANNFEIGFKGSSGKRVKYGLAVFYIDIDQELIPFELEDFPGRTFYRNAGSSSRKGLEFEGSVLLSSGLIAQLSYTYSDFQYEDFATENGNLNGNQTPGIPKQMASLGLNYLHSSGFFAIAQSRLIGELFTNDANTVMDSGYVLTNLRLGHSFGFSNWTLEPFLGINNIFDTRFNSNIRINAFGGRYFEPGAERNIYLGVKARFGD